jgi:phosphate transport system permease protein
MSQPAATPTPPSKQSWIPVNPALEARRNFLDKAFRVVGFLATFFGLGMLALFVGGLLVDVGHWFNHMPHLIEDANVRRQEELKGVEKQLHGEMAKIDRQLAYRLLDVKTVEEKAAITKFYEDKLKPKTTAQFEQRIQELTAVQATSHRHDTSPLTLFSYFMTSSPGAEPQDSGIMPALLGSIWLGVITVLFAVPLGVGAALYLEEYAPHTKLAKLIQINISNLAGVPSVVFGMLGAFLFVELIFKPMEAVDVPLPWPFGGMVAARNVLGGGMTLALLTLPVVIVSAQEAIRAVPISIRHGAYALGATKWQTTWTLVLPCSLPGVLTGTILAMARAMGEAAPLVLFGAIIFVNQNPTLWSRFTVLPMQIFAWCDEVEVGWRYNAALASLILLLTLMALNGVAIWLRQKYQSKLRW